MDKARLPPGPRSFIPGRFLFELARNPPGFLERLARTYGDVAFFKLGPRSHCLLNRPEFIQDVLITRSASFTVGYALEKARVIMGNGLVNSAGPLHARQRRLVQRSFHKQRIAGYAATMVARATARSRDWRDGERRDIDRDLTRLMQDVVLKTLFDVDAGRESEAFARQFKTLMDASLIVYFLPYPRILLKLPIPKFVAIRRALACVDRTIYGMVADRRKEGRDHGDLLSEFVAARDIEADGQGMSDRQIRDECVSAFAAGHETTSSAVAWALYLIASHPEVDARLCQEIEMVLEGRAPTYEDAARLPFARAVLSESMRLYPPAWHLSRRALEDYEVGGYRIPAGTIVMIDPWVTHRDPRWFPDPERFDPDRFTKEGSAPPAFGYLPFGGGVRSCIGEGFAWMATLLVLAVLVRDWRFELDSSIPVTPAPLMTLRPKGGLPMIVRRRRPSRG